MRPSIALTLEIQYRLADHYIRSHGLYEVQREAALLKGDFIPDDDMGA
jgi:hypothetical protein